MMKEQHELLQTVFENASIGRDILGRLIQECGDSELRALMAEQFAEYHRIMAEAEQLMDALGEKPRHMGWLERAPIFASMSANLKIDRSSAHLAEMMIRGSLMALIEIARTLRHSNCENEEHLRLADRLKNTEENNIKQLLHHV